MKTTAMATLGVAGAARAAEATCPTAADTLGLPAQGKKIPVIFDTDIGNDIDDTWALAMMLGCPELDVRLVAADAGNTIFRAKVLAKMLEAYDRTDIPVAVGIPRDERPDSQSAWVEGYDLADYPGTVHDDGVQAIVDTIKASPDPVTLICIGGVPNISAALERDPSIMENSRFVGAFCSIYRGYGEGTPPCAEANILNDPAAAQAVFTAPWECTVAPLDTSDRIRLSGGKYQAVYQCEKPGVQALIENYRLWRPSWVDEPIDIRGGSSTLFDTASVYLAFSEELFEMEELPLRLTDDGYSVIEEGQKIVRCMMKWRDLGAFEDLLVERLVG